MQFKFKHLDLNEIEGRLNPEGKKPSARGRMYWDTEPGRADTVTVLVAHILKDLWSREPERRIRITEFERHKFFPPASSYSIPAKIPAAVKRLARIGQVKLDFNLEGVLITPGSNWIETPNG